MATSCETLEFAFATIFACKPETGSYTVLFPALPGVATEGATLEEARGRARECLKAYLECIRLDRRPLPASDAPALGWYAERVTVQIERDPLPTTAASKLTRSRQFAWRAAHTV